MQKSLAKALGGVRRYQRLQQEADRRAAQQRLLPFIRYTFNGDYQVNWHHELACREIDEWLESEEPYNLMVCMPPRHGKSEICSRMLAPYIYGKDPDSDILFATYNADLAGDMSRDAQRVMLSRPYHEVFPDTRLL
ncbi:hypothetical protein KAR91_37675, partial [Candidatus Pacearchaeota archaeon]|nr:hypothetical protein [Candidatus Pacearchaeota archaeon]